MIFNIGAVMGYLTMLNLLRKYLYSLGKLPFGNQMLILVLRRSPVVVDALIASRRVSGLLIIHGSSRLGITLATTRLSGLYRQINRAISVIAVRVNYQFIRNRRSTILAGHFHRNRSGSRKNRSSLTYT